MCKNNSQTGFTLIEVMISMVIFAVISLISYNAIQTYGTHQKLSFEHFEKINALQKMTIFVKRDMNHVANQNITLKTNVLTFESLHNDTVVTVRYFLEDENLVRKEVIEDEDIVRLTLVKNIKKFKIRLLNSDNKWLLKYDKRDQHIIVMELSFESDYWGEIKQLVRIDDA